MGNISIKYSSVFSFLMIMIVLFSGCSQTNASNQNISLTSNPENSIKSIDNNISADEASAIIQNFMGVHENLTFERIMPESYADFYIFRAGNATFWINNVTHRVQNAVFYEMGSKAQKEVITLDQGSAIAEAYARQKYPELWNVTDKRGVNQTRKEALDRGMDRIFMYSWAEILYNPDNRTIPHTEIRGINSVSLSVNPYTGNVTDYGEWYLQPNNIPDTTPDLTEDQAWAVANKYLETKGITNIQTSEKTDLGLHMNMGDNLTQDLVWTFDVKRESNKKISEFLISVDAHKGQVVFFIPL